MNSEKSACASLAKYQKCKLVLSLYRSKAERKCKHLYLAAKRKNSSGEPNIQVKLARLDNRDSPSNIGHHSINIVKEGVVLESANLCNPVPPTINSSNVNLTESCGKIFGTELRTILINLHHSSSKESGKLTLT